MTTKRPRSAALATALALAPLAMAGCGAPRPVAIGISSSASHMDAARLAISDVAAELGVELDTVFIPEAYSTAAPALRAAEELVNTPGMVAVVGHSNSGASLAASPVYNAHQVVQVAPTSTAPAYSEAGPYSFRIVPPDSRQGEFLARALAAAYTDSGRVAVTYVNDDYGRGLHSAFTDAFGETRDRPRIVLDMPHVDNLWMTRDSAVYLEDALVAARPDVILWLGRPSSLGPLWGGLRRRLGDALEIIGGDALSSAPAEPTWRGGWDGVRYAGFVDLESTPELRRWARRYQERFGPEPTPDAALMYDATGVVLAAIKAGARTGPKVRQYLLELGRSRPPYPGLTGALSFDENGDAQREYRLMDLRPGGGG